MLEDRSSYLDCNCEQKIVVNPIAQFWVSFISNPSIGLDTELDWMKICGKRADPDDN